MTRQSPAAAVALPARLVRNVAAWLPRGSQLPDAVWSHRHRVVLGILFVQSTGLAVTCLVRLRPAAAIPLSVLLAALGLLGALPQLSRRTRSAASALGLLTGSAVLVQLSNGMTESLFQFFVMLGVVAIYQEWLPFLLAGAFTITHHVTMGVLQPYGASDSPFAAHHPVAWIVVHVGFVLAAEVAILFAWRIAEEQRGLSEQVLSAGDGVYGVDGRGRIQFINDAAMRLLGAQDSHLAKDAALGRDHHLVFGHSDEHGSPYLPDECPTCAVVQAAAGEHVDGSGFTRLDSADIFPVEYVATPRSGRGGGSVVAFRDVSERVALQQQLIRLALQDPATGLPNRSSMQARLESAVARLDRRPEPLAVLFCDLDRFKEVNDTFGHAAGDELLQQVARRLQGAVRGVDTVARFAGDEFVLLCEGLSSEAEVGLIAERVLAGFSRPFEVAGELVHVGCSVGAVTSSDPGIGVEDLLRRADAAMYRAKMRGRGGWQQFDPALARPLSARTSGGRDEVSLPDAAPQRSSTA